jgi:hypothetical protein
MSVLSVYIWCVMGVHTFLLQIFFVLMSAIVELDCYSELGFGNIYESCERLRLLGRYMGEYR